MPPLQSPTRWEGYTSIDLASFALFRRASEINKPTKQLSSFGDVYGHPPLFSPGENAILIGTLAT